MAGASRTPIASARKADNARMRGRRYLDDILYPGALTSRLKRYAAEPAPDAANLTSMCERTANDGELSNYRRSSSAICLNGYANWPAISEGKAWSSTP